MHGTSQKIAQLSWASVLRARAWTIGFDDGKPGDFRRFWREVLKPGERWKWYEDVTESIVVDATAAVLVSPFGPYGDRELDEDWWLRSVANSDTYSDISLSGLLRSEIA